MNIPIPLRFYYICVNKLVLFTFFNIIFFNSILLLVHKHESCRFHDYQNAFLYEKDILQHHVFTKGKTDFLHLYLSNSSYCEDNSKGNLFPWLILLAINVGNLIKSIDIAVYKSFDYFTIYLDPENLGLRRKLAENIPKPEFRTLEDSQSHPEGMFRFTWSMVFQLLMGKGWL